MAGFRAKTGLDDGGCDREEARRALALLMFDQGWHEITTLPSRRASCKWLMGAEIEEAVKHAAYLNGKQWEKGVYLTLNPARDQIDGQAKDGDMACRRWLFLDVDAHEKGKNATEEQRAAARQTMEACRARLTGEKGWPAPVVVDSGNGFYLLFRLDGVPADAVSRAVVHRATQAIGAAHGMHVDAKVTNAARICRVPGTMNRKGPEEEGRPHRMCRLVEVPSPLVCVPWKLVEEMAGPEPRKKARAGPKANGFKAKTGQERKGGYGAKAFQDELAELRSARDGERNDALNKAAFALYQLVAGGELNEGEVTSALEEAARAIGLPDPKTPREIQDTLKSARAAGFAEPRSAPPDWKPTGAPKAPPQEEGEGDDGEAIFYPASEVKPRKVEWIWQDRVPLGKLSTFAGMGGLGKTFLLLNMVAHVTTGTDWPDGGKVGPAGKALFISGEDEPDDTLVPRLIEMGADLSRVFFMRDRAMARFTLAKWDMLEKGIDVAGEGVRLIVIDPPTAFLGGVNDHNNSELREVLFPLKQFAERHHAALVFNTHINKGGAGKVEAMMRVMGSVAWVNTVRSAHLIARDPEDRTKRLFMGMKTNLGPEKNGLAYRIAVTESLARLEWLGEIETTADEAMSASTGKKVRREVAASEWLIERFRERLEWPSAELIRDAREANISRSALWDAKKAFRPQPSSHKVTHESGSVEWLWRVPADWPHLAAPGADEVAI